MSVFKRKGQIVPRYLVKSIERKAQHIVKFGCDVEIIGSEVRAIDGGTVIVIPDVKYCNTRKSKRTVKGFELGDLQLSNFDIGIKVCGDTNISTKTITIKLSHKQNLALNYEL